MYLFIYIYTYLYIFEYIYIYMYRIYIYILICSDWMIIAVINPWKRMTICHQGPIFPEFTSIVVHHPPWFLIFYRDFSIGLLESVIYIYIAMKRKIIMGNPGWSKTTMGIRMVSSPRDGMIPSRNISPWHGWCAKRSHISRIVPYNHQSFAGKIHALFKMGNPLTRESFGNIYICIYIYICILYHVRYCSFFGAP